MSNCDGIELTIQGKKVCIPVYYALPPWGRWPWPGPDPLGYLHDGEGDPEPTPWLVSTPKEILEINSHCQSFIEQGLIDKSTLVDHAYLHLINKLTGNLSPAVQKNLKIALSNEIAKLNKQTMIG